MKIKYQSLAGCIMVGIKELEIFNFVQDYWKKVQNATIIQNIGTTFMFKKLILKKA